MLLKPEPSVPEPVPLVDLTAQYLSIRDEIDSAIAAVIAGSRYIGGAETEQFEAAFAGYCGARRCVGVSNGTHALQLVLQCIGVGPGDEVILPSMTFIASAEAVCNLGATPVLVDIDPVTCTIDVTAAASAVTPRTRCLMAVHLHGQPCDMAPLMALAERHGLFVLEDAAQAHGAVYDNRSAGALGHAAAFSFYPGKNLGAYGDAGAVVTDDDRIADWVAAVRNHGRASGSKFENAQMGTNCRIDNLQAAILLAKLAHLDAWNATRQAVARRYNARLNGTGRLPPTDRGGVFHVYALMHPARARLRAGLAERGIATGMHYPIALHQQPSLAPHLDRPVGAMPESERVARECLSLPIFPELTDAQVDRVADAVDDLCRPLR